MPSPFPGMDPYLEAHWRDVHASLVIYSRDALQGVLPSALRARVEESVLLETPVGLGDHPLYPDVRVVEYISKRPTEAEFGASVAVAEQALVEQCYRNGAHEGTLNYAVDPDPPRLGAEKEWANKRLRETGLRIRRKPSRRKGKPKLR